MPGLREQFWARYRLEELNPAEWEALCDGCGQCCLLREIDDDHVSVFSVACELLDIEASRCSNYAQRFKHVPECTQLTPGRVAEFDWLPETCAYRRVHLQQPLPDWHPLLTGSDERMHEEGFSVRYYALGPHEVTEDELGDHIIARWPLAEARAAATKARHQD